MMMISLFLAVDFALFTATPQQDTLTLQRKTNSYIEMRNITFVRAKQSNPNK